MFNNFLMTTVTPLRDTNEFHTWDNRPFTTVWPECQQGSFDVHKDISLKKTIRKKKRHRTAFSSEQLRVLEKTYARTKYIENTQRKDIAERLQIDQRCIKIWFQNRRMKDKKNSQSGSCDSSSESTLSTSPPLTTAIFSDKMSEKKQLTHESNYVSAQPVPYSDNQTNHDLQSQYDNYNIFHNFAAQANQLPAGYSNITNPTTANGSFQFDSNVYPTQYYPPYADLKYHNVEGHDNNQYINPNLNEWPASTFNRDYLQS